MGKFEVLDGGGDSPPEPEAAEFVMDGDCLVGVLIPHDEAGWMVLAPVGHSLGKGEGRARLTELRKRFLAG
ncbi:MAG: hypothetical protein OXM57_05710 [bacterium]|nr:hypothetical protein [bacterium]MDE0352166.1 hypothetical protein [bacterium]